MSYYGKGALLALGLDLQIRAFSKNKQSLDDLMRLLWRKHGTDGIAEDGIDDLIFELLGNGFTKTWNEMKARYIFGVEDIPLQKWIGSNLISVEIKSQSTLEKLKLQFGMRHTDANGWLKVTHVLDGGVAQAAGIAAGDLLASIDGQRLTSTRWDRVLGSLSENTHTRITFYREDLEHERMVSLESAKAPAQYELLPNKDI